MPQNNQWVVYYMEAVPPDTARIIASCLPPGFELRTVRDYSDDAAREALQQADFLLVATRPLPTELLACADHVRLIQHQGVGYDRTDVKAARARGIPVALCPEGTTIGVAEHTFLLILALYKQLRLAETSLRAGEWRQFSLRAGSFEIAGKTLGLVGFGRIGQAVASRAKAFEAKVIYTDIVRASDNVAEDLDAEFLPMDDLLAKADIVSLHLPATPQTRHLINPTTLAKMKLGSLLINTARGSLVDEAALLEALKAGHLLGAGLDVFEKEPPDPDNPLLSLPNVVVTPHIAAGTQDALVTKMKAAFANMERVARGEPALHVIE